MPKRMTMEIDGKTHRLTPDPPELRNSYGCKLCSVRNWCTPAYLFCDELEAPNHHFEEEKSQ